jgi:alkanesulfonate monooxygenase SsuD/methylene tetrahydromethanopterin reductase-like flavin-dependent oxidoreductase (luciferase family)
MTTLKLGAALPYTNARTVAQLAQLAEETGWEGVFLGDAIWCEDPLINLAAAATVTNRIRLGMMVVPVPLRRPWKLASESLALDHLSDGRLTLGLGTGAVWMGWQAFPDEVTVVKTRAGMLDETIDILTLLYQRKPFDYAGQHYHIKLTLLDEKYYPPRPVQQPRIPLWAVGIWPSTRSMRRALKCDGVIVEKIVPGGQPAEPTPEDIRALKSYVDANRSQAGPYDIVVIGQTEGLEAAQAQDKLLALAEAGVTWWVEAMWEKTVAQATNMIRNGPPGLGQIQQG